MTTKEKILEEIKDINYAYNECSKYATIKFLLDEMEEELKEGIWTTHEVACLLAEATGDDCACNVNGNDEWLPFECIFAQRECPNVGVACWEQWLVHRKEKQNEQID